MMGDDKQLLEAALEIGYIPWSGQPTPEAVDDAIDAAINSQRKEGDEK
ncbi:hypothetical protein [Achromobacter aloeverae]|nr:hypothetical protein [Achromobacter aloeverae]